MNNILNNLFYKEKLGKSNKTIKAYTYQYKITAPPRTFQIDIFWWKKAEKLIPILFFVPIVSRKAWAYVLTISKKKREPKYQSKIFTDFKMK